MLNPSTLTPLQQEGWACIRCGSTSTPMAPVKVGPRGQLFACTPRCP